MNVKMAVKTVRKAVESRYDGRCTIYGYKNVEDKDTHLTSQQKVIFYEEQSCHLSYETVTAAEEGSGAAKISQAAKLFCAPELVIAPGSCIVITQAGHTEMYERSGKGAVYETHQEIPLRLSEKYA